VTIPPELTWVVGVGVSILAILMAAVWKIVDGGAKRMEQMLSAHTAAEAQDLSDIRSATVAMQAMGAELEQRISRIEAHRDQIPTVSMVHQLSIAVTQLAGKVETVDAANTAKIEAMRVMGDRLEIVVRRIEDFLSSRSR
jgi:hypothetical protein